MTPVPSPRTLRGRRGPAALLSRSTELLSLDVFGLALQPSFLDAAHRHELVASIVGRHLPALRTAYPELRQRAERKARAVADGRGHDEVALATIADHLQEILIDCIDADEATMLARFAIDTELELGWLLGRPNPDALELHRQARQRGIPTAMIADSCLPRDLVARIVGASGYRPDFVIVSSNEGRRKRSGLYQRLLAQAGLPPETVVHLGPDQHLDVEIPLQLGIRGQQAPTPRIQPGPELLLDITAPGGLDSLALTLATQHLSRGGAGTKGGYNLGYYAGGPLLVGFTAWLGSVIERTKPDQVLLCGPTGQLLDESLTILCPQLEADERHVLGPTADGSCPVARLAATTPLRHAERVLVAGLGLFEQDHRRAQQVLDLDGRGPVVSGAYLGLPHPPDESAMVWAFDDDADCPIRTAAYRRPELLEAMLRLMPVAAQDVNPGLRPFHAAAGGLATGALTFAGDVEPWLHLDHDGPSRAMIEPALRVITDPTPAEAMVLCGYPARHANGSSNGGRLATPPSRSVVPRGAARVDANAAAAPWSEGYRALARRRPGPLLGRARGV